MTTKNILYSLLSVLLGCHILITMTSCDSFLDITPTGMVIATTGAEYRAMLTKEYDAFPSDRYKTSIRTDEVTYTPDKVKANSELENYLDLWRWKDEDPSSTTLTFENWTQYYHAIYVSNYIIEHQNDIVEISAEDKAQLVGEAYMMRGYCHFLLVNLYAEAYTHCTPSKTRGVPIMLEANVNAVPRSSSVEAVYQQVLADVITAEDMMNKTSWEEGYNYRFNKTSATALLARTYLYMGNWQAALTAAKKVIASHGDLVDLVNGTILPDNYKSVENIVALEKLNADLKSGIEAYPNTDFIARYKSGDGRRLKYFRRPTSTTWALQKTDGYCSFRSAEAYLTAAEAACQMGNTTGAIDDYMKPLLQKRLSAALYATTISNIEAMTQAQLLQEIYDERARELAFEGHRWYDLRRTTQEALTRTYGGQTYTLTPEKYTIRFPSVAVEANPEIEIW